jgi:peptidoglycan/xylan/chitin deacetylase (PgdA/CDA1 family)
VTAPAKPAAALSLDLDNAWTYLRAHGHSSWVGYPSFLDIAVPRILDFLAARDLTITFFVVGKDAEMEPHHALLALIADAGHEIGNHSYGHEYAFPSYTPGRMAEEIERAEMAIERVAGRRPVGFRGPAFGLSAATLETLVRRGYRYDASTFPTYAGPLLRAYQRWASTNRTRDDDAAEPFGGLKDGRQPNTPYRWDLPGGSMVEVPVTTMPLLRLPIHLTYLNFLAGISPVLAVAYFRLALRLCRLNDVRPSLLLHATDFLGRDDTDALPFLPGMNRPASQKLDLLDRVLTDYGQRFVVLPINEFVTALESEGRMSVRSDLPAPATVRGS